MSQAGDRERERDAAFASCIDRLNRGESIDRAELRARHPELADELLAMLEAYEGLGAGPAAAAPPARLGHYRIVRELGRGGMGVVHEAIDEELDRRVALKLLPPGLLVEEKALARFRREAKASAQLQHPGIVPVYALGVLEGGTPYIAMELVDGESLEALIARKQPADAIDSRRFQTGERAPLGQALAPGAAAETTDLAAPPPPASPPSAPTTPSGLAPGAPAAAVDLPYCVQMARAFADVAAALQEAHAKGIVHRDLKPSNLLLDRGGRLRILDFGIARLEGQESLTQAGEVFGTPRYMSPEQARGDQAAIDHRTDVYSLGATLYEALTLTSIFQARTPAAVLHQVLHDEPRPLRSLQPRVPIDLATIVHKCLAKRREDRYRSAEALAQDLERFVRGDAIEARPPTWSETMRRRLRRHWGKVAVLCGLALLSGLYLLSSYQTRAAQRAALLAAYPNQIKAALSKLYLNGALFRQIGDFAWAGTGYDPWRLGKGLDDSSYQPIAEALALLEAARNAVPDRADAYYQLARAHWLLLQPEKAFAELETAERRGFGDARAIAQALGADAVASDSPWFGTWARAQRAARDGDLEKATALYVELDGMLSEREEPFFGAALDVHLGCGLTYLRRREPGRARDSFRKAQGAWPQAAEIQVLIGVSHLVEGGEAERDAERIFEEVHQRRPDGQVAGLVAMLYAVAFERYDLGLRWAERVPPGYLQDLWRAVCLLGLGRSSEAAEATASMIRREPNVALSYFIGANAALQGGDLPRAEALAKKAAELVPDAGGPHAFLGNIARLLGRQQEALSHLERAVEAEPTFAHGHYYLGLSLLGPATASRAETCLRRAIELGAGVRARPFGGGEPFLALAVSCLLQGNMDDVTAAAREAVRRGGWGQLDPQWLPALVRAHEVVGEPQQLLAALERMLLERGGEAATAAAIERLLAERYRAALPDLPTCRAVDQALQEAGRETPIAPGATWSFFRGTRAPSPGHAWAAADFDDAAWERGASGIGYGDDDDATVLEDMQGSYTSVYLRGAFQVSDPSRFAAVELEVTADDGFVAYLNGRELGRIRAPAGELGNDAAATLEAPEPLAPAALRRPAAGRLVPGRNVLAVQGLNISARSSDLSLLPVLRLIPGGAAAAARGIEERCREALASPASKGRRLYLEGRLLELAGDATGALPLLAEACDAEASRWEPIAAFVRCARAAGKSADAAARLRAFLATECPGWPAWLAWGELELGGLGRTAAAALDEMPRCAGEAGQGLRLLLGELQSGRPVRLATGSPVGDRPTLRWAFVRAAEDRGIACRVPLPPGRYQVSLTAASRAGRSPGAPRPPPTGLRVEGSGVQASAWSESDAGAAGRQAVVEVAVTDGGLEIAADGDELLALELLEVGRLDP